MTAEELQKWALIKQIRYHGAWLHRKYNWIDKCSLERLQQIWEKLRTDVTKQCVKMTDSKKPLTKQAKRELVKGYEIIAEREYIDYMNRTKWQ